MSSNKDDNKNMNKEMFGYLATKEEIEPITVGTLEIPKNILKYSTIKSISERMLEVQQDVVVLLKDTQAYLGKSFKIEQLMFKLQPALNKAGIILEYKYGFDQDAPVNPYIYYPATDTDKYLAKTPTTTTVTTTERDVVDNVSNGQVVGKKFDEVRQTETKTETKTAKFLGKTVFFYKFDGAWVNAQDKNDKIPFTFSVPVELKDNLDFSRSSGAALTYAFRTHLARQYNIPVAEDDADFENVSEEVKKSLQKEVSDNEFSRVYKDILTLDNKCAYVVDKESNFMQNIKPTFLDCEDFYSFLKFKFIETTKRDIPAQVKLRAELKKQYELLLKKRLENSQVVSTNV